MPNTKSSTICILTYCTRSCSSLKITKEYFLTRLMCELTTTTTTTTTSFKEQPVRHTQTLPFLTSSRLFSMDCRQKLWQWMPRRRCLIRPPRHLKTTGIVYSKFMLYISLSHTCKTASNSQKLNQRVHSSLALCKREIIARQSNCLSAMSLG
jgi:hypothetical protein